MFKSMIHGGVDFLAQIDEIKTTTDQASSKRIDVSVNDIVTLPPP